MEFGIYSFAEIGPDPVTGKPAKVEERLQHLLEEIEMAEKVGLDVYAVGEHHRPDYAVSSPAVVLAAAAVKTSKIKLSSAVTVLSSDDPVRVFQDFATVDLLSKGRAEIMAGRGSFIESFPLFGYDLRDYDELFEEKLELLIQLNESEKINWSGKYRSPIKNQGVYPRPYQEKIPIWVAVGGTPQSAIRAAKLGLPMAVAIIGGSPAQFGAFVQLYRDSAKKAGTDPAKVKVGINSHVFIAEESKQAADIFYPSYADTMSRIGRERGWSAMNRQQYELMRTKQGALLVGSPDEVIEKMLYEYDIFKFDRFLAQMTVGTMPHDKVLRSIELFGRKVVPGVKKELSIST